MFAQQRLAHNDGIPRNYIGTHREAIHRRGLNDRQLAKARHGHLQRAGNGRGGEREHMNVGLECLQPLLVGDAEALFLIDDHKTEAFEFDGLGEDRVRADHDIECAIGDARPGIARFLGRDKPRKTTDPERESLITLDKRFVMLSCEQRGWADYRHLLPCHRRHEGGAQSDFGLAETDIAAHEAVHRLARAQIVNDLCNRAVLIVGFLIREAVNEFVKGTVWYHDVSGPERAFGGYQNELARDFADSVLHLRLATLPGFATKAVEDDAVAFTAVAREDVDVLDRDEQLVAPCIG